MKHSTLTMFRRVMAMTLALLLVVGLTGCIGTGDDKPTDPPAAVDPTTAPTEAPTEKPTEAPTEAPTEPPVKGVMGTVSANNLNVRSNPSNTDSTVLSQLPINLRVEILEQKTVGGTSWGRIGDMTLTNGKKVSGGWLNLHYVKLDNDDSQTATEPNSGTSGGATVVDPDEEKLGTVTAEQLQIRKGAGTTYDAAGSYKKGDRVKILETKTVSGTTWGKTDKGWISMTYVKLDGSAGSATDTGTNVKQPGATTPTTGSSSGTGTGTGTSSSGAAVEVSNNKTTVLGYVVVDVDGLTLRTGPSTKYKSLGTADEGDRYPYYQTSNNWYRTSHGWLSNVDGAYLYIEGDNVASDAGIAVVKAQEMYVRQGPGTNFKSLTTLKKGESLPVRAKCDGWGYIYPLGWINLDSEYVDFTKGLTYTTGSAEVLVSSLNIRESASAESKDLGNLTKGNKITVLEISSTDKNWGKVEYSTGKYGWIHMRYVKMTSVTSTPSTGSGTYSISIPTSTNGTVTASAASCVAGTTVTLYTTPDTNYKVGSVSINNGAVPATLVTGTTNYTFTMPAANVTVNVTFIGKDSTEHSITINAGSGGNVVAAASKFASGQTVSLTVTPAGGYELEAIAATNTTTTNPSETSVLLTNAGNGVHTFDMPAGDVKINATFKKVAYTATAATSLTGGTVGAPENADTTKTENNYGDTMVVTVTPATGYKIKAVKITYGGSTETATADTTTAGKYTFKMPPANVTVTAEFEKINYALTINAGSNGTVTATIGTGTTVVTTHNVDDSVKLTVTPATGYQLKTMTIKHGTTTITDPALVGGTYTFTAPAADVVVTAEFEATT